MRDELVPTESALEASPKYRKDLAAGFLYKVPCCQWELILSVHSYKSSPMIKISLPSKVGVWDMYPLRFSSMFDGKKKISVLYNVYQSSVQ